MRRLFLLILQFALLIPTLSAQKPLPQYFDDYELVINTDSLERIVYAHSNDPVRYMHGLVSLELSRITYSDKQGQDIEHIKALATQTKSDLGTLMYRYLKNRDAYSESVSIKAMDYLELKALFEARKDTVGIMTCYDYLISCNVDNSFVLRGDSALVEGYYNKITELGQQTPRLEAKLVMYLSQLDNTKTNLKSGVTAFNKALNIINQNPIYEYKRIYFYMYLGCFYERHKLYKEALTAFLSAYQQSYRNCSSAVRYVCIDNVAHSYMLTGNFTMAKKYYKMAIEMSKNNSDIEEELKKAMYESIAKLEFEQKNYTEAWHYRNSADSINDIIQQQVKSKDLIEIQIKYEADKKEIENQKLQLEKENANQRSLFLAIALTLSMLTALTLIWFYQKTRNQNTELQRLYDLTNQQNQHLAFANNRMQYFTRSLSHDVLGYIHNIMNFLNMAKIQNTQTPVDQTLEKTIRNASHLKAMSENLIRYSRVEQSIKSDNIDLNQALTETLDDMPSHAISWDIQPLPNAHANHEFIKQVFNNLIGNALKYRKLDTPLNIQISAQDADEQGNIKIEVRDNGKGIDADKLTTVFNGFEKDDINTEGVGLGLFICEQIVNNMGGKIWAESEKGVGSCFYFTLPKSKIY